MQRVMIVGAPGSGKSTLARELGARTGLPVFHMDLIHHLSDWKERPHDEKVRMAHEVETKERWIFEGGLSATYETRLARADTLIWLDLPVGLRLWRVTKRLFRYLGQNRPDLPEGCNERLHPETVQFYQYIWRTRHRSRAKIVDLLSNAHAGLAIAHLRSPHEVRDWLESVEHG